MCYTELENMNIDGVSHCLTSYKLEGSGFISPMV